MRAWGTLRKTIACDVNSPKSLAVNIILICLLCYIKCRQRSRASGKFVDIQIILLVIFVGVQITVFSSRACSISAGPVFLNYKTTPHLLLITFNWCGISAGFGISQEFAGPTIEISGELKTIRTQGTYHNADSKHAHTIRAHSNDAIMIACAVGDH